MAKKKEQLNYEQKHILARVLRKEVAALGLLIRMEGTHELSKTVYDGQITQIIRCAEEIGIGDFLTTEY